MKRHKSKITGHLDIFIADHEDEFEGEIHKWQDILIHDDPEGLRSFAKLLIKVADLGVDSIADLPIGAREHIHLQPDFDISKSLFLVELMQKGQVPSMTDTSKNPNIDYYRSSSFTIG